jgi:hypothetical protein
MVFRLRNLSRNSNQNFFGSFFRSVDHKMRFCVEGKRRVKVSDFCHNCGVGNCFARVGRKNCFYHYGNDYALGVGGRKGNFGCRGSGCEKRCVNREEGFTLR